MGALERTGPVAALILLAGCFQAEAPRPATAARPEGQPGRPDDPVAAVIALAEDPDEKIAPLLAQMLRNEPDPAVRQEAVYALADIGAEAEAAAIAEALRDPDVDVRLAAIDALSTMEGESPAGLLASALNDASPRVRLATVNAFGDMEGPTSTLSLQQALADPDTRVRATAAQLLEERSESGP